MNLRVRGQNLFDQGCAGARHPQNEDRQRRGAALSVKALENGGRKCLLETVHPLMGGLRIIVNQGALHAVALMKITESLVRVTNIQKGLAQCKIQTHTVCIGLYAFRLDQILHFAQRRIIRLELDEIGTAVPCAGRMGIFRDNRVKLIQSLLAFAIFLIGCGARDQDALAYGTG